jgi:tRNA threonylcarbamoyladenosine biosynthesis protein TsaE
VTGRAARRRESASATETEALGARLAAELRAGDAVIVQGELGVGKTTFVRGACRALGVTRAVTSPTFTIGQRYEAVIPIAHLDLFRIGELAEEDPDLLADYVGADTISFIELPPLADDARAAVEAEVGALARVVAWISLTHAGGDQRIIEIQ